MLGPGTLAKFRPAARHKIRRGGSSQRPEDLHQSLTNTVEDQADHGVNDTGRDAARPAAGHERRGSSGGYLGYLLCAAGRPDLLATRRFQGRLPPEMPPMC
jgi:hypothetical protein